MEYLYWILFLDFLWLLYLFLVSYRVNDLIYCVYDEDDWNINVNECGGIYSFCDVVNLFLNMFLLIFKKFDKGF